MATTDTSATMDRYCGRPKRSDGQPCKRLAGWSTDHKGRGPCRDHGGRLANVRRRYAREEAIEFAREHLDADVDIGPIEAALANVRTMQAVVRFQNAKLAMLEVVTEGDIRFTAELVTMAQRVTQIAITAGVAERLVAITERWAEQLTLAFEEALAGEKMPAEQKARIVARYGDGLTVLEGTDTMALEQSNGGGQT